MEVFRSIFAVSSSESETEEQADPPDTNVAMETTQSHHRTNPTPSNTLTDNRPRQQWQNLALLTAPPPPPPLPPSSTLFVTPTQAEKLSLQSTTKQHQNDTVEVHVCVSNSLQSSSHTALASSLIVLLHLFSQTQMSSPAPEKTSQAPSRASEVFGPPLPPADTGGVVTCMYFARYVDSSPNDINSSTLHVMADATSLASRVLAGPLSNEWSATQ